MKRTALAAVAAGLLVLVALFALRGGPPPASRPAALVAPDGYAGAYFCGRRETLADGLSARPWPVKTLRWALDVSGYSGPLSPADLRAAFMTAWAGWTSQIDRDAAYTDDPKAAHVVTRFGAIDGPYGVLAWSELADGTATQKHQLFDSAEAWSKDVEAQRVCLRLVAEHEIGHVLGLVHDAPDSGALMAPIYNPKVLGPTARDVQRLLDLGYARRPPTTPATPPAPTVTIRVYGGRVEVEESPKP